MGKDKKGVALSRQLDWIAKGRGSLTRAALKWILEHKEITSVIPGFKNVRQVEDDLQAIDTKGFAPKEKDAIRKFYREEVVEHIPGGY